MNCTLLSPWHTVGGKALLLFSVVHWTPLSGHLGLVCKEEGRALDPIPEVPIWGSSFPRAMNTAGLCILGWGEFLLPADFVILPDCIYFTFLLFQLFKKINLFFNWRVIAFQNFAVFCQTSTWISHGYTYILSLLNLLPISLPMPPFRLVQSPCLSFLRLAANSRWLFILHMVMEVSMLLFPYISPSPPFGFLLWSLTSSNPELLNVEILFFAWVEEKQRFYKMFQHPVEVQSVNQKRASDHSVEQECGQGQSCLEPSGEMAQTSSGGQLMMGWEHSLFTEWYPLCIVVD